MRILYLMKTQDSNLGDLLINRLLIGLLAERADSMLFDVTGVSESYRKALLSSVRDPVVFSKKRGPGYYLRLLLCRRYFDVVIAPPGHAAKADWRHVVPIAFSLYYRLLGVRYMRLGKSFRPTAGFSDFLERLLVRLSHHTMVRDGKSLERIRSFKDQENISCEPDLIVLLSVRESTQPMEREGLLVSFRYDHHPAERRSDFVREVVELTVHHSQKRSLPVTVSWQVERDEACALAIANELESRGIRPKLLSVTADDFADIYRSASLILSNRLHVALTALTLGADAWAVCDPERDRKIVDAFTELGLGDRVLDVGHRDELKSGMDISTKLGTARERLKSAILHALEKPIQWT